MSQINAVNNQALRVMPPGMTPPILVPFNASSVGVVQMTTSFGGGRIVDWLAGEQLPRIC